MLYRMRSVFPSGLDDDEEVAAPAELADLPAVEPLPRAARGTFLIWNNGYFSLYKGPTYITVRVLPWLLVPALLGHRPTSKTIAPEKVGDTHADPKRVFAVLRAWTLHRMTTAPRFLATRFRGKIIEHLSRGWVIEICLHLLFV